MIYRKAVENDAPAIAAIIHAVKELKSIAGKSTASTAEKVAENLRRVVMGEGSTVVVAETGPGEVSGYCAVH